MFPLFYFPTKVLIIDDDYLSLKTMSDVLGDTNFIIETSDSSINIPKIDKKIYSDLQKIFIKISPDYYKEDTKLIRISNNEIHKLIYSAKRFEVFSVIVVDYHMPIINGLELLELLHTNIPVKKILITGDTNSQLLAINAFNANVIDGFINKLDMAKLPELVTDWSNSFFEDFSSNFTDIASYRLDTKLYSFIEGTLKQKKPAEYYPLNDRGSHLFLNKSGEVSALFIETETNIVKFLDFMKAENLNPNVYSKIYSREYMPIIHNYARLDDTIPINKCTKIEGSNNIYYYAYLENTDFLDINTKKIATFDNFQKRLLKNKK